MKSSISIFKDFLLVLAKLSFLGKTWALGYNSLKFWDFPGISLFPRIQSLRFFRNWWGQLLKNMCIRSNDALFHLWWKENHLKHQKVSRYYDQDYHIFIKKMKWQLLINRESRKRWDRGRGKEKDKLSNFRTNGPWNV